ncbi:hypothetical protein TGVAND_235340 [Toxoplasma gondii VAND]|uniref:Uncharacterized protein n=1 Tax=Toxoplasma gondii VAND TaxID=933077 RepID=A0A086PIW3_TOXGO|nr:hypothetical protein TGVAND_235340 [Toxoplasma gondii VAND]
MDSGSQSAEGGAGASRTGTPAQGSADAAGFSSASHVVSGVSVAEGGTRGSPSLQHFSTTVTSSSPRQDSCGLARAATLAAVPSQACRDTAISAAGNNSCHGIKYQTPGSSFPLSATRPVETSPVTLEPAGSGVACSASPVSPRAATACPDKLAAKQALFSATKVWQPSALPSVQALPVHFISGKPRDNAKGQPTYTSDKETFYFSPKVVGYRKADLMGEKKCTVQGLPSSLPAGETGHGKRYLEELNLADTARAQANSKMPSVPLSLLERLPLSQVPGSPRSRREESRCGSFFPLIRIRGRRGGPCEVNSVDLKRFLKRVQLAAFTYCEDMKRLVQAPFDLVPPAFGSVVPSGQAAFYRKISAPHCPNCGYNTLVWAGAPCPEDGGVPVSSPEVWGANAKESGLERLARWHCSFCGDIAAAVDDELLGCTSIGGCTEAGDRVDQYVAEGIHGLAEYVRRSCAGWMRGSQRVIEGYPLYEPDPALCRKERPTSLTGNMCVDQLNAFLDACLVEPHKMEAAPPPPRIPDTQQTGNWLVDKANAMLDRLCEQKTPPSPPPAPKSFCPPVELLIPPCCRASELPPIPPPAKESCPLLDICRPSPKECPQCHQQIGKERRGGKCPAEPQSGGVVECCLQQDCFVSDREEVHTGVYSTSLPPHQFVNLTNYGEPANVSIMEGCVSKVAPVSPTFYRRVEQPEAVACNPKRAAWIDHGAPRQVELRY